MSQTFNRRHSDTSVEPFPPPDYHDPSPEQPRRRTTSIDSPPHSPNTASQPRDVRRHVYVVRKTGEQRPGFIERCTAFVTRRIASLFDTYFPRVLAGVAILVTAIFTPPFIPAFLCLIALVRGLDLLESLRFETHTHYQGESPARWWHPPQFTFDGVADFKLALKQKTTTPTVHRLDGHTGF